MAGKGVNLYYLIFEWPLGSMYLSVLLVNFNSREYVRGQAHTQLWAIPAAPSPGEAVNELEYTNLSGRPATRHEVCFFAYLDIQV